MTFAFDDSYARRNPRLHAPAPPTPVVGPRLLALNRPLATVLGLDPDDLASDSGVQLLAGNHVPEGTHPIALAYAGHQFGHFVPQLGDGRAILLGERLGLDGVRREVQLKGAGRTAFSRRGDGRAALGPVLREYLLSEAMAAHGIPTTRALAAVATGEVVYRDRPLPGAVLARVATSHLRVGTFEYFAARADVPALEELVTVALERHHGPPLEGERPALHLLDRVLTAQAELVARWLGLGFVHGVMNTDNMSISGETLDYGPAAFLDTYRPDRTFSSIDTFGRYAYDQQPRVALWNLSRLGEALLPLIADDEAEAVALAMARLESFPARHAAARLEVFRRKLGLLVPGDDDAALIARLLELMAEGAADFSLTFRRLTDVAARPQEARPLEALFRDGTPVGPWLSAWKARLAEEPAPPQERARVMGAANPVFIPRNHHVEAALAAAEDGDLGPFQRLQRVLARPFEEQPEDAELSQPPGDEQWGYQTFCGT